MPSASATVERLEEIWKKRNRGKLIKRVQKLWIKVKAHCCVESKLSFFGRDNYYKEFEWWYPCGEAGDFDLTDPEKSLEQLLTNLKKCQDVAKQKFDCKKKMGGVPKA